MKPQGELITDLAHFLDKRGRIAPVSGPARRLADHLVAIVVMATTAFFNPPDGAPGSVRCRKRPNRRPCAGYVDCDMGIADLDAPDEIMWWCKVCDDHGTIRNWQGTFWDMSEHPTRVPAQLPSRRVSS